MSFYYDGKYWAVWEAFKKQVKKYLGKQNNTSINIELNGTMMTFNGLIVDGKTYVQLRELGEKTGYFKVGYDNLPRVIKLM